MQLPVGPVRDQHQQPVPQRHRPQRIEIEQHGVPPHDDLRGVGGAQRRHHPAHVAGMQISPQQLAVRHRSRRRRRVVRGPTRVLRISGGGAFVGEASRGQRDGVVGTGAHPAEDVGVQLAEGHAVELGGHGDAVGTHGDLPDQDGLEPVLEDVDGGGSGEKRRGVAGVAAKEGTFPAGGAGGCELLVRGGPGVVAGAVVVGCAHRRDANGRDSSMPGWIHQIYAVLRNAIR
mmetsp:Transcript_39451/g.92164  ORF Transcript_39451/g.92164 Transcript_39451/m.92164 type:complete len:231 (-) Transcript_39451:238-930(-)